MKGDLVMDAHPKLILHLVLQFLEQTAVNAALKAFLELFSSCGASLLPQLRQQKGLGKTFHWLYYRRLHQAPVILNTGVCISEGLPHVLSIGL